jgi:hypothetical protein
MRNARRTPERRPLRVLSDVNRAVVVSSWNPALRAHGQEGPHTRVAQVESKPGEHAENHGK